jgi:hypothetical protein
VPFSTGARLSSLYPRAVPAEIYLPRGNVRVPTTALVFGSMVTGAVLWTGLEVTIGDPFDSVAYPVLLLSVGVVTAWLNPYRTWRWSASIFVGELVAYIALVNVGYGGPLWAVGILFLLNYAVFLLIGGWAFRIVRGNWPLKKTMSKHTGIEE